MRRAMLNCLIFAFSIVMVSLASAENANTPTTSPAAGTSYDLRIEVFELGGPLDKLKASSPEELVRGETERRKEAAEAARKRIAELRRTGSQPASRPAREAAMAERRRPTSAFDKKSGVQLVLRVPSEGKARAAIGTRVPVARSVEKSRPEAVSVNFEELGATAEIARPHGQSAKAGEIALELKLSVDLALDGTPNTKRPTFEKSVSLAPGKTLLLALDEAPVAAGDDGEGRWLVAGLELTESGSSGTQAQHQSPEITNEANTQVQIDCIQMALEAEAAAGLDLHQFVSEAPSVGEIIKRLKAYGEPILTFSTELAFDPRRGIDINTGERVPVVRDVGIARAGGRRPSVSYSDVGTMAQIEPLTWKQGERGEFVATAKFDLENSGVTLTPIEVGPGLAFPGFSQWKVHQSHVFHSGVPAYFTFRGPPTPATSDGMATVYVARLVLTKGGEK